MLKLAGVLAVASVLVYVIFGLDALFWEAGVLAVLGVVRVAAGRDAPRRFERTRLVRRPGKIDLPPLSPRRLEQIREAAYRAEVEEAAGFQPSAKDRRARNTLRVHGHD